MWRIFSRYLKTITCPILIPMFFSRSWDNIASGEDDDSTEVIHPGAFCLLGWLIGWFCLFFKPSSTNENKGVFSSSHTCKSIMKVHGKRKKPNQIQSVQTIMVCSSSHELAELKQA